MRALAWLLVAAGLAACQPPLATVAGAAAAELEPSPAVVGAVVMHADDARRAAFASADSRLLEPYFGGRSLLSLRLQIAGLAARGQHRAEVLEARRVVHQGGSPGQPEAVLEIRARRQAGATSATVLRQWRARLGRQGEAWLVMEDGDLPPAAWWR